VNVRNKPGERENIFLAEEEVHDVSFSKYIHVLPTYLGGQGEDTVTGEG
jgi:hypothetical protein